MPRNVLAFTIIGALMTVVPCGASRPDEAAPGAPTSSDAAAMPYAGPLKRAPAAAYLPLRSETVMRSGPSSSAPVVSTLSATAKPLQALGMVVDEGGTASQGSGEGRMLYAESSGVDTRPALPGTVPTPRMPSPNDPTTEQ